MNETPSDTLVLSAADVPPVLHRWLSAHSSGTLIVSAEQLGDGVVVLQALPGVDPTLVAQLRKIMAQYADVLRRLT